MTEWVRKNEEGVSTPVASIECWKVERVGSIGWTGTGPMPQERVLVKVKVLEDLQYGLSPTGMYLSKKGEEGWVEWYGSKEDLEGIPVDVGFKEELEKEKKEKASKEAAEGIIAHIKEDATAAGVAYVCPVGVEKVKLKDKSFQLLGEIPVADYTTWQDAVDRGLVTIPRKK